MTPLRITRPAPAIAALSLDRPQVHNALDSELVSALRKSVAEIGSDESVRAVVLGSTTSGMFCAGADLTVSDDQRKEISDELYRLYEQMIALPVPIVASVDGAAVGGGAQLALAADVRLGSASARFRFVGPGHGLVVGMWGLPSTVGRRAMEIVLSQRFVAADEAVAIGLLDRLVADPLAEAVTFARATAELDRSAVARAKERMVRDEQLIGRLAEERAGNAAVFTGAVSRLVE